VGARLFASFACYGLFFNAIGWRGLLWIGVLPTLEGVIQSREKLKYGGHR
jgi:hypothetical protein